jgi:predicted metal-binding membrane protein
VADGAASAVAAGDGVLERVLRRDRWIVASALALLVALCWLYLLAMADAMRAMMGEGGSGAYMWLMPMGAWSAAEFALALAMWIIMMIGMMVPSAAPAILLYSLIRRREQQRGAVLPSVGLFAAGYLAIWAGFSLAAAGVQFGLTEARLMSDLMESSSAVMTAAVLILAGVYQLTAWKGACLAHCRSPIAFLSSHWSDGPLRMGVRHGMFCLGCCWAAMCVLFAVGVMNLAWIAALSALVLLEKTLPRGDLIARISGVLLIVAGVAAMTVRG